MALARFICHAGLPISIGEHPALERYIKTFVPHYQSVSRVTIRSDIVALFNKRRQTLIEDINNGTFNVALTSDIWSGRAKEDYLSVVIHYIDSDWVIQKRIIGFRLVDTSHTSTAISERILNVLVDYDLTEHVIAITLDNAAANTLAIAFLRLLVKGFHEELFHQ